MARRVRKVDRSRGQSLVEFSLVLIPFLFILMAVVDLGRGIYTYNSVAQAAREIARAASVHPCNTTGCSDVSQSTQANSVKQTQKSVIPGLTDSGIAASCTNDSDTTITDLTKCGQGKYVKVTVTVSFSVLTPVLSMVAPSTMSSTSHIEIP